ncbi:hypothetical protein GCM10011376_36280 [Nocardioides flavus (ex Wang et al. 2016)]|uniref:Uncharacterized protein n=1 Tax=Nocardioides flavus (ex Wang et al. 2016) TaxID=2058780 RepID=A0ABQ3HMV0_9ACTN|nr:hypothetical protein [Nocardioides flavus (ex Wang et al. 2016)]GHE19018.1 hypothetical protein GCM10011376_36280 [Nocardioides flavus (ex Wang et al. 2016)]
MKLSHTIVAVAAVGLFATTAAAPAQAREWLPIEGHDQLVLATCSDGSQVLSAMITDLRRNRYSMDFVVDRDGNTTGVVLMLKYAGGATHSTTGQTIEGSGVDRIVVDFVTGDQTSAGGRWTVNLAGEGWVVKEAGRITYDGASGEVDFSGIASVDWAALCPFFGVPA